MSARWRSVPGWEGLYSVSDCGRIKSHDRVRMVPRWGKPVEVRYKGRELTQSVDRGGYRHVTLHDKESGRKQTMKVHRAVAMAFIPNPLNLPEVNHIDNTPDSNHCSNLEWVCKKGNAQHRVLYGNHITGEDKVESILTQDAVADIRANYVARKVPFRYFAEKYGVSCQTVCKAYHNQTWREI